MGEELISVKDVELDGSATDISGAFEYASSLFEKDVIKRIVLITDGKETITNDSAKVIASVENLYAKDIYIDAVYLDSNLPSGAKEVQVDSLSFTASTYVNHYTTVDVLVSSSYATRATAYLYKDSVQVESNAVTLTEGLNVINFELDTDEAGTFAYSVKIVAEGDGSSLNNEYTFTQSVEGEIKVLLVTDEQEDYERATELYGERATVVSYVNNPNVPFSIDEIVKYDEIMLSNVDIRSLNNYSAFVDSVEKAVSLYGKSLVTIGDLKIQNKTDDILKELEDMLPATYGNNNLEPKLFTIVLDTSRSMQNASHLIMAKAAACKLVDLLDKEDYVSVVSFAGEVNVAQPPIQATDKEAVKKIINAIQPIQGTFIGRGLSVAYDLMKNLTFSDKQVMLISDGMSYSLEPEDAVEVAKEMWANGIMVSSINTSSQSGTGTLAEIAYEGGGEYYYVTEDNVDELILSEVADDLTESVIEEKSLVKIVRSTDEVLDGITSLPEINGFLVASAKPGATTVLSTAYVKSTEVEVEVPVYCYWEYGSGRVSSFTSSLSGEWVEKWQNDKGTRFFKNLLETSIPDERISYPYTLNVEGDGVVTTVELLPAELNPYATATVKVTLPSGDIEEQTLTFDSARYFYSFACDEVGAYKIEVAYSSNGISSHACSYYHLSYLAEYDAFTNYDISLLSDIIRNRGTVNENADFSIENDADKVATYEIEYTMPFMIAAIVIYLIDIIIRKLKWEDIKGLFKKKKRKEGTR